MSNSPTIVDVKARREEIKALRLQIARQDQELLQEDNDLLAAERALLRLSGVSPAAQMTMADPSAPIPSSSDLGDWVTSTGWRHPGTSVSKDGTLEQIIEWLLSGAVNPWAESTQIAAAVASVKERQVPMSSISPTLWNMKKKGTIVRDGLKVALASRVAANRAAVG
jgi:hypothetical protein